MPDLFFNKVAGLEPATLLKKKLQHWCFPVNFAKVLSTSFFTEQFWGIASENLSSSYLKEVFYHSHHKIHGRKAA